VHLQPMKWVNDWPVIGIEKGKKGTGEPVMEYKKPNVGKTYPIVNPAESDEFESPLLGKQWQWQANPDGTWLMPSHNGVLRLYTQKTPDKTKNLLDIPNVLTQKFPADNFMATVKIKLTAHEKVENEKAGFAVVGQDYSQIAIKSSKQGQTLVYGVCKKALTTGKETEQIIASLKPGQEVY